MGRGRTLPRRQLRSVPPATARRRLIDDQRQVRRQIFAGADQLDYAFMGTDPSAHDNVWLREAAEQKMPDLLPRGLARPLSGDLSDLHRAFRDIMGARAAAIPESMVPFVELKPECSRLLDAAIRRRARPTDVLPAQRGRLCRSATDPARARSLRRIVKGLEQPGFQIDEADQVMRKRSRAPLHGCPPASPTLPASPNASDPRCSLPRYGILAADFFSSRGFSHSDTAAPVRSEIS